MQVPELGSNYESSQSNLKKSVSSDSNENSIALRSNSANPESHRDKFFTKQLVIQKDKVEDPAKVPISPASID